MHGGGMHGGGMHGGGMHGGGLAPRSSPGGPASANSRFGAPAARSFNSSRNFGADARYPGARPAFYSRNGSLGNRLYGNGYNRRYGYGYPVVLNYGFGYPLYDNLLDYDNDLFWGDYNPNISAATAPTTQYDNPQQYQSHSIEQAEDVLPSQNYPQEQAWRPPYATAPQAVTRAGGNPPPEDTTTLVFKDGRPPEQIRNYALSRTAIYVTGQQLREIPLDELDLAATVRVNQQAGTPFQLP